MGAGSFYRLSFKLFGVFALTALASLVVAAGLAVAVGGFALLQSIFRAMAWGVARTWRWPGRRSRMVVFYPAMFAVLWPPPHLALPEPAVGHTSSAHIAFRSDLRLPLLRVTPVNLLLTVITLACTALFAAVAMARVRLEPVSLTVDGPVDDWLNTENAKMDEATGGSGRRLLRHRSGPVSNTPAELHSSLFNGPPGTTHTGAPEPGARRAQHHRPRRAVAGARATAALSRATAPWCAHCLPARRRHLAARQRRRVGRLG
ncbi:MAG: DUF898 family protein, partial [Burkholderiales bacterium]|nr:DUF898 family protein [Burkholderiales bacterium]